MGDRRRRRDRGIHLSEQALALQRAHGDLRGAAESLNNLGAAAYLAQDLERAAAYFDAALDLWRGCHDTRGIAIALRNAGETHRRRGALDLASPLLTESVALLSRLGDRQVLCGALASLGDAMSADGRVVAAARTYGRCLRLAREVDSRRHIAEALEGVAGLADDAEAATRLRSAAVALDGGARTGADLDAALDAALRLADRLAGYQAWPTPEVPAMWFT